MKKIFVIILSILSYYTVSAQSNADIGIWGGIGSYTGDMTHVDKASSLNPNFGLFLRYNFNSRVGLRTSAMLGPMGASGKYEENDWEFKKFMADLSLMGEFNFFRYIMGSKRHPATTYLLGGVGASMFNYNYDPAKMSPMLYYLNPVFYGKLPANVQQALITPQNQGVIGLNIPIGFGFKFNVGKRMGVGIEAILRKYFNDKIDNLDDPRKYYTVTQYDDTGAPVGGYWQGYNDFLHNNDFTIHFGVHLTYRFYQGGQECPVYENIN